MNSEFNCPKCGYERYEQQESIQPELTTELKLMWLVEKYLSAGITIQSAKNTYIWIGPAYTKHYIGKTLAEAINAAYEWAKEQEDESNT